jgi:predicted DNA-binding ribbon-helix-helix protein
MNTAPQPLSLPNVQQKARADIHMRISKTLKAQLEALARERDCTMAQLIRDVLNAFLATHGHQERTT